MNAVDDDGDYWDDDDDDYAGDDYDADGVGMIDEAMDEADSGYTEQLCVLDDCQFDLCDDLDQPNSAHGEGFFQKHTSAQHVQADTLTIDKYPKSREPGNGKTFSKKYPGSPVADRALNLQLMLQPMDKVRPYSPSLSLAVAPNALWIYPNSLSSIRVRFLTYVEMLERLMRRLE